MGFFFKKHKEEAAQAVQPVVEEVQEKVQEAAEEVAAAVEKVEKAKRSIPWINQETGIAFCGDDRDIYLEILHDYVEEGRGYQQKLADCLASEDWKNFAVYVHAVKSSSKTIGSEDFGEEARVLEFAAKEDNAELIRTNWEEFCEHFEEILAEAEAIQ